MAELEPILKSPWAIAAYFAVVIAYGAWKNRGLLADQGKRLVAMLPKVGKATGKASDEADLAALRQLCRRYKDDELGHAAIGVLKARFLLVPGAVE